MARIMVLFGSGGHSTEMLMLVKNANLNRKLNLESVEKLMFVISDDDELIQQKLTHEFDGCTQRHKIETLTLSRARRVGQSYITAVWTTLMGIFNSLSIVQAHSPNLCLTNGPAISVTMSLAIRCLQMITFGMCYRCAIVYVESFCRTRTLSLAGKLIYHLRLADEFYVQWPTLHEQYPRTRYRGILV